MECFVDMLGYNDETSEARPAESVSLLKKEPQATRVLRRLHGVKAGDRAVIDDAAAPRISMSQTILLVDDDDAVRELFARMLRSTYEVLEACSSKQARQQFDEYDGRIDLVICDVVMPGGNGPQLAEALMLVDPTLRLLYVSGYPPDTEVLPGYPAPHIDFLQKPFSGRQLVARVATLLSN
jgi:two-component system cell cycle sensor histidine kinase/response regulator CckA